MLLAERGNEESAPRHRTPAASRWECWSSQLHHGGREGERACSAAAALGSFPWGPTRVPARRGGDGEPSGARALRGGCGVEEREGQADEPTDRD